MKNYKKIIAAVLVVAIVASCAVGATLAWLQDKTQEVKNTFAPAGIDITLEESETEKDNENNDVRDYKMIPGAVLSKDPKATVLAGSEECYLFVEVIRENDFDTFITSAIADGWEKLDVDGKEVYYRTVPASETTDQEFEILAGNTVTVKDSITNDQMDAIEEGKEPKISFKAYAIQTANTGSVTEAWAKIQ